MSARAAVAPARPRAGRAAGLAYAASGAVICVALYLWQGTGYWSYSDGVYAYTARALLDGAGLYSDVAAAQPPPTFWAGALALAPGESIETLRAGLALVTLASGALVAAAVWRLTAHRVAAVAGGAGSLLAPWAVREHALLTPETFAAPLLMGAALLGARGGTAAVAGGALGAGAGAFKLTWLVPAAAIALVAADRRRFLAGAAGTGIVLGAVSLALYGGALWDNVVTAQLQTGTQAPRLVLEYAEQAAWNLAPLAVLALLAMALRDRARDPALLRTLIALALGAAAILATLGKDGSYVNVVVPVEPPLVALGAAGVAWLWTGPGPARARGRVVALAAVALAGAQTASLLAAPDDPAVFRHPWAGDYYARIAAPGEVDARAARARRCEPGVPFSGPPFIAFVAGRSMPGNQGDPFIINRADILASQLEAARRDRPRCPAGRG